MRPMAAKQLKHQGLWSSPGLIFTFSLGHTKTETLHMSNCLKNAVANGDLRQESVAQLGPEIQPVELYAWADY